MTLIAPLGGVVLPALLENGPSRGGDADRGGGCAAKRGPGQPFLRSAAFQQAGEFVGQPVLVRLAGPAPTGELVVQTRTGQGVDHINEPIERGTPAPPRCSKDPAYQFEPAFFDLSPPPSQVKVGLFRLGKHLEQGSGTLVDGRGGCCEGLGPFGVGRISLERVAEQRPLELWPVGVRTPIGTTPDGLPKGRHQQGGLRPNREMNRLRRDAGPLGDLSKRRT
jgi:hypothetical protein